MILCDSREPKGLRLAVHDAFEEKRIPVGEDTALRFGDFWLTPLGNGLIVVERKTPRDLSNSVIDKRLWKQLSGCLELGETILLIEGNPFPDYVSGVQSSRAHLLHPNAMRGVLFSAQREGVRVVQSASGDDTVRALIWLYRSAPLPHESWRKHVD